MQEEGLFVFELKIRPCVLRHPEMFSIRGTFKFPSINWLRLYVRSTEAERKTAIDIRSVFKEVITS